MTSPKFSIQLGKTIIIYNHRVTGRKSALVMMLPAKKNSTWPDVKESTFCAQLDYADWL